MENKDDIKKLSTGISGLDDLFFGGLQIHKMADEKSCNGLVVLIRGTRGINKTLFAMQMMQGLTKDLRKKRIYNWSNPKFYSLNKNSEQLSSMYIDFLISKKINDMIIKDLGCEQDRFGQNRLYKSLFDYKHIFPYYEKVIDNVSEFEANCGKNIDKLICERTLYYNNRTGALHFRRPYDGDDINNLVFYRKGSELRCFKEDIGDFPKNLDDDFFEVEFNCEEQGQKNGYVENVPQRLQRIIGNLEGTAYSNNKNEKEEKNQIIPCVVIDGFAQLKSEDLDRQQFIHIEEILRKSAMVSILIFDERGKDVKCNADIVIEMKKKEDETEKYTYHDLQSAKCVFQNAAYGWHQYKKREYGIEVFPSRHKLLHKPYYLSQIQDKAHAPFLERSYTDFLNDNSVSVCGCDLLGGDNDLACFIEKYKKCAKEDSDIKEIYDIQRKKIKNNESALNTILSRILLGSKDNNSCKQKYVTAIIGNPNTFKRFLTVAGVFSEARNGGHSLILLFDKDEQRMKQQMICPITNFEKKREDECKSCHEYIHFLSIRTGGLFSDELFDILKRQIDIPFRDGKKIDRIVIDDLQKIDYSFPFLKRDNLFLTTLINLCHEKNVRLYILCDKRASLAKELCCLSDNVICMERNVDDKDNVKLYLERSSESLRPSKIYKYELKDIYNIFSCSKETGFILRDDLVDHKEIGSMKDFWRDKVGVYANGNKDNSKDSNI